MYVQFSDYYFSGRRSLSVSAYLPLCWPKRPVTNMTAFQRKKRNLVERCRLVFTLITLCRFAGLPITKAEDNTSSKVTQPANLNQLTPTKARNITIVTISTSGITRTDTTPSSLGITRSTSMTIMSVTKTDINGAIKSGNTRTISGTSTGNTTSTNSGNTIGNTKSSNSRIISTNSTSGNTANTINVTSSSTTRSTSTAHDPDSYCRKPLPLSHVECDNRDWGEVSCLEHRARIGTDIYNYWQNHCTFRADSRVPSALLANLDFCAFDMHYGRVQCGAGTPYNFTAQCRFTMLHCIEGVDNCKRKFERLFEEGGACAADGLACPSNDLYYLNKVIFTNSKYNFGVLRKNKILEHCHLWDQWKTNLLVGVVVAFSAAVALYFVIKKSKSLHARHFNRKRMEEHVVVKMLDNLLEEPTVTIEAVRFQFNETRRPENNQHQNHDDHNQQPPTFHAANQLLLPNGGPPPLEFRRSGSNPVGSRLSSALTSDTVSSNRSSFIDDLSFQPGSSGVRFLARPHKDARPVLNSYQLDNNGGRSSPWHELLPSKVPRNPGDCERPSMSSDCSFSNPTYLTKGAPGSRVSPAPPWGDPLTPRGDDEVFEDAPHFHAPEGRAIIIGNPSYL